MNKRGIWGNVVITNKVKANEGNAARATTTCVRKGQGTRVVRAHQAFVIHRAPGLFLKCIDL